MVGDGSPPRRTAQNAAQDRAYDPYEPTASGQGATALIQKRCRWPDGFEIAALFAEEPMLANPVCLYVDDDGGVWIGETFRTNAGVEDIREHMDWLDDDLASRSVEDRRAWMQEQLGDEYDTYTEQSERIRVLRDTDGDGVADVATVYADGFDDHLAGIGAGLLVNGSDVYYTCIPDLWKLRDTDGDDVADGREALSSGYGVRFAFVGHDLHGLRIGPDGRLYFSIGDRGLNVPLDDGRTPLELPDRGAVLRCELDGSGLELVHTGLRNPQELAFDDWGNLFTGDNNADAGDEARWVQIVFGGDSGWRQPYQWLDNRGPWKDENLWKPHHEGQAAYIVPPLANVAAGPSGLAAYPGTGFGPEWNDHFFLCDFHGYAKGSGVMAFTLEPAGASFALEEWDWFVKGTLATDADFGPDGALYISDWVEGWTTTGKGRVFRVHAPEHAGTAVVKETQALLAAGLAGRKIASLSELLAHPDRRVRTAAQFELTARGDEGLAALGAAALADVPPDGDRRARLSRLHGVWGLGMAGRRDPAAVQPVRSLLTDPDPQVRAQAFAVFADVPSAAHGEALIAGLSDTEPRVRYHAALALARLAPHRAVDPLVELIAETGEEDPYLRFAATRALEVSMPLMVDGSNWLRTAEDERVAVRVAVAVIMRRREDPNVAKLLADDEPRVAHEAARAIYDLPIEDAVPALADRLHDFDPEDPVLVRRALAANRWLGGEPRARHLADYALRDDAEEEHRVEALEFLVEWADPSPRDPVVGAWRPLERLSEVDLTVLATDLADRGIEDSPEDVVVEWVRLAHVAEATELAPMLRAWVEDTDRPGPVRVEALKALKTLSRPAARAVIDIALNDADPELRAVALDILDRIAPEDAMPRLPAILEQGEAPEQRVAFGILGRTDDELSTALLAERFEKLRQGLFPVELTLDLVLAAEQRDEPMLEAMLRRHRQARAAEPELAPYLDGLFGGDAEAGDDVFERPALSCRRCHATWDGAADRVGPNLAGIGHRLARLQMLEAVVDPNRRTAPGWSGTNLFLEDGRILSGRVVDEIDEAVIIENADGEAVAVPRGEIRTRRAGLSAMPEGLASALTREEMRDLLAYLASL